MKVPLAFKALASRAVPLLLLATAVLVVLAPAGIGLSSGANKDTIGDSHFAANGCTACHGPGGSPGAHEFAPGGAPVTVNVTRAEDGAAVSGNRYEADTLYNIRITLDEQNEPGEDNHAGFNLRASAGKLSAAEGEELPPILLSGDGTQATHTSPAFTSWTVAWTAPADGPAVFDLFVNDVDGSAAADAGDQVHRVGFYLTGEDGAVPGAAAAEHAEFGITLQQYWIGLIGLAGMIFIMLASFLYLKFVNPHSSDAKDR